MRLTKIEKIWILLVIAWIAVPVLFGVYYGLGSREALSALAYSVVTGLVMNIIMMFLAIIEK